jgi:hypothetical protein
VDGGIMKENEENPEQVESWPHFMVELERTKCYTM